MVKEAYVSFEVAKLLKKKGFDEPCRLFYKDTQAGLYEFKNAPKAYKDNPNNPCFLAPSLYMTMKWLRKKYYIYADPIKQGNYNDCSEYYTYIVARMGIIHRNSSVADKLSYEEAVEAALKYSLENLI